MALLLQQVITLGVPLLLTEGFYSGSELALISLDPAFLPNEIGALSAKTPPHHSRLLPGLRAHGLKLAFKLSQHPERIFSTTLLMSNVCMVLLSALVSLFFLQNQIPLAELAATLATSPLILIFGEILPKTHFQRHNQRLAPWVAYPLYLTYLLFYPLTRFLENYTLRLSRILAPLDALLIRRKNSIRDEIRHLISTRSQQIGSDIKRSEERMIKRIFDFQDAEAKHALIPLVQVEGLESSLTVQEALEQMAHFRELYSEAYTPVYTQRIDNIVGVLKPKDLLQAASLSAPILSLMGRVHYVPETQSLRDLLIHFSQEDHSQLIVVVDEHGGAVGTLTFEDVIEEIVGVLPEDAPHFVGAEQPHQAADLPPPLFVTLSANSWSIQASMEIAEIHEMLNLPIPKGDYETLSGFLLQELGHIPPVGEELTYISPPAEGVLPLKLRLKVQQATDRHIETVLVEKIS